MLKVEIKMQLGELMKLKKGYTLVELAKMLGKDRIEVSRVGRKLKEGRNAGAHPPD